MTIQNQPERTLDVRRVLSYLKDEAHGPLPLETLAAEIGVEESDRPQLQALLDQLTASGEVIETRGRFGCPDKMNLVVGELSAHPDGFGFVTGGGGERDVFVSGKHLGSALHGDRVVARVEHRRASGKIEGRIIRVLERSRTALVGTIEVGEHTAWVTPREARLTYDVQVPLAETNGAESGQIVQIELTSYPDGKRSPAGKVVEVLGDADDSRLDVEVVIREYDLPHRFPDDVLAEAAKIDTEVQPAQIEGRTDFRETPIVTIDGESAQDFDDAVYVELLPNGNYRLQVHIADVSHYVTPGSAMDTEALRRGSSVYFPDRVVPMLPEQISNEICSLRPGVDRLVQSAIIDIDRSGRTVNYDFQDGVIRSAARATYKEVAGVLAGSDEALKEKYAGHAHQFERMRDLAEVLVEYRRERGSIDFDLPEPELLIDLRGEVSDIIRAERNVAHRIIEEFMIRANEVVASHLTWEGMEALYRVHDGPDPERIAQFREFISGLGHTLGGGSEPRPRHLMELMERVQGRPEERVISTLMLRTMKQARYQVENVGHFGLASERYSHFTSPIRRYPDLVIHRLLRAERGSEAMPALDLEALHGQLESVASQCSFLERRAEQAERAYVGWKKAQFMKDRIGEEFEGHITGVKSFGFFVELEPIFVEGLVAVSSLTDDYYRYDEAKHSLRAEHGKRALTLGDRVKVAVAKVDLVRTRLDFSLLEGPLELPAMPAESRRRPRRRGRRGRSDNRPGRSERPTQDDQPVAANAARPSAAESKAAPAGSETPVGDEQPRRRRRRGTRGGRKRTARGRAPESGAAEKPDAQAGSARGQDGRSAASEQSEQPAKSSAGRRKSSGDRPKRSAPGKRSGDDRKSKGKGDRGSRRGGRPRRSQSNGVLPAPAMAEPVASKKEEPKKGDKPAVNPYLTEIDY